MNSRFFNKETIEIYGHASTDVFNENNVYFLKCKYSVWTEFTKHLLYAFHNYLHKVIHTNCEQCDYIGNVWAENDNFQEVKGTQYSQKELKKPLKT